MNSSSIRERTVAAALSVGIVVLAFAVSIAVIAATGSPPVDAVRALWDGAFGGATQVSGTLTKMIPTVLAALGWIVAFAARRINVGLQGQMLLGGVCATAVGLNWAMLPIFVHLPLAVLAGILGGTLFAGVAAWLWARHGVNELLSTLLLNLVAVQIVNWLVRGPMQEPTGALPHTERVLASARWPILVPQGSLSWDVLVIPVGVILVAFLLRSTVFGFQLRLTGASERTARHAGIATVATSVKALLLSGGLAGLAGSSLILGGESARMTDNFASDYGFEGIVVALLARNSPAACLPAALLFAVLRQGGGLMEARVGVSSALVLITQGIIILLVALSEFLLRRQRPVHVDERIEAPEDQPQPSLVKGQ